MRDSVRLWAILALAYAAAAEAIHLLWTNRFDTSAAMLANGVAVPAVQLAVLSLVSTAAGSDRRAFGDRFGLGGFFAAWLLCAVTLGVTTLAVGYFAFRTIDLTAAMMTMILFVPVGQAAAFCRSTSRPWAQPDWRAIVGHPLAGPVLAIDGLMLPAGWLWPAHPLFGMADAAVMQRRWMGTKVLVAAVVLAVVAIRGRAAARAPRATLLLIAVLLAAVAVDAFTGWMFASAAWAPAPLSRQPRPIIWIEGFAGFALVFLWSSLAAGRALSAEASQAAYLLRAGSVLIFFALLALLMNGFLSWQPVHPWAGVALTLASLAGTCFGVGALRLAGPSPEARTPPV